MIPGPGETVAGRIADINERDIVVIIGIRRIVGKIKRYLEVLRQNNVRILPITDPSARVAPAYAQWTISCPVENPHVFDSYTGVPAVFRLLAFETFRKSGSDRRQYMEQMESRYEILEEFE